MSLSKTTVPALLDEISALWPSDDASSQLPNLRNPYALVAAAVFSGTNRPDLIPTVWSHAVTDVSSTDEKALVARRLRDAIFKAGLLTGYSRAINALISLNTDLPEEYRAARFGSERGLDWPTGTGGLGSTSSTGVTSATEPSLGTSAQDVLRPPASLGDFVAAEPLEGSGGVASGTEAIGAAVAEARAKLVPGATHPTLDQIANNGLAYFNELYGTTAEMVQSTLDGIYPDMGYFSGTIAYGLVYGGASHLLSLPETSIVLVASLIAMDTPRQVGWHLANTRRLGVSLEQVRSVREMAIRVSKAAGVTWFEGVPEAP